MSRHIYSVVTLSLTKANEAFDAFRLIFAAHKLGHLSHYQYECTCDNVYPLNLCKKNQHIYLEKAPKDEKIPAIAVFFLKKSPKYLILSGLVKLVEKNHPLIPMENKRLDNITKTQFL